VKERDAWIKRFHRLELVALLLILAAAFTIRWWNIDRAPSGLEQDEVDWVAAAFFNKYGVSPVQQGIWAGAASTARIFPVSIFLIQTGFTLFGDDPLSARKMAVLCSVVSLFFFYLFLKELTSTAPALMVLLLYAFSTYKLISGAIPFQHPFLDLCLYPACLLLLGCLKQLKAGRPFAPGMLAFCSAACLLACVFTYNVCYLMPVVFAATLVVYAAWNRTRLFRSILAVFLFLAPFLLFSKPIYKSIVNESQRGSYAFERSAVDLKYRSIDFGQAFENAKSAARLVFRHMDYENSDMLARYDTALIDPVAGLLLLLGLIAALGKPKKYCFVLVWLFVGLLPFHVLFGFLLPRMWFVNFGLLYMFAALGVEKAIAGGRRIGGGRLRILLLCIGLIPLGFALYRNVETFYTSAVKNFTFRNDLKEVSEIAKRLKPHLKERVLFITEERSYNYTRTLVAFHWLAANKPRAGTLNDLGRSGLGVFSQRELQQAFASMPAREFLVVEKPLRRQVEKGVPPGVELLLLKENRYFPEFSIESKPAP
jgi:hypothetical protein